MMSNKPMLLIYGNCQAGALAYIFGADPTLSSIYSVRHFPSFDDGIVGSRELCADELATTELLFEQVDPKVFPYRNALPAQCTTLSFPAVDLTVLWPLFCKRSYDEAPTRERPWGRFPQGDRVIVECVERGLSVAETIDYYHASSANHVGNIERHLAVEKARLSAREANADVKISDYLFEQLPKQNMFWSINHPTMAPLQELCRRLLEAAMPRVPALREVALDATIATLPSDGPLGFFRVPIHPAVVDHFNLEWYRAQEGRNYGLRYEARLTYEEYIRDMIELSVRVRASLVVRQPNTSRMLNG